MNVLDLAKYRRAQAKKEAEKESEKEAARLAQIAKWEIEFGQFG